MDEEIKNFKVIERNLEYFTEHHSEIYDAYKEYGRLVHELGGPLDEKTRWLIKIALSTNCQNEYSLRTHILKAMKSGCSKEEIEHVLLLCGPTCGFPKTMNGLRIFREVLDWKEKKFF